MKAPDDVQQYIDYYDLPPAGEHEDERALRARVALALRDRGLIIESHEVNAGGVRWDRSPGVVAGIAGAAYNALNGIPAPRTPAELDAEVPTGFLALGPEDPVQKAVRETYDLLGPEAATDLLFGPDDRP